MASHDPLVVSNTYLFGFPPHGRARSVRAIDGEGAAHRQHLPTSFLVSRPVNEVPRVTVQGFRQPSRPIPGHPPELFKPDAPAISDTWKRSAKGRTNSQGLLVLVALKRLHGGSDVGILDVPDSDGPLIRGCPSSPDNPLITRCDFRRRPARATEPGGAADARSHGTFEIHVLR